MGKLKSKGHGKLSIHFTADYSTIEIIFRIIVSANQLSLYGAVAEMCEEFESQQDRSGELAVLMGQSKLFLFLEMFLVFQMDRCNLIMMFTNVISLTRKSM